MEEQIVSTVLAFGFTAVLLMQTTVLKVLYSTKDCTKANTSAIKGLRQDIRNQCQDHQRDLKAVNKRLDGANDAVQQLGAELEARTKSPSAIMSDMGRKSQEVQHDQKDLVQQVEVVLQGVSPMIHTLFKSKSFKGKMKFLRDFVEGKGMFKMMGMGAQFGVISPEQTQAIEAARTMLDEEFHDLIFPPHGTAAK